MHHRVGVKHPQIPTVAHFALHIDEHRPARLIGVPVRGATQLLHKRLLQGREQRRKCLQAPGQRARRHVQPVIGQVLQQPIAGAPVDKLVQQHAGPYRQTELATLDQPRGDRCRYDSWQAAATADGAVPPTADHAPIGLDLKLYHLRVFGAGERAQAQPAFRACRADQLDDLHVRGQVRMHLATMPGLATLVSPRPARHRRLRFVGALAALALAPEHALLQITNLRLRHLQFAAQGRLAQCGLIQGPTVFEFGPAQTQSGSVMAGLPVVGLRHQLDMFLFGERHAHGGKRHRLGDDCVYATFKIARHRAHAANRNGKSFLCPAISALRQKRVHRMFTFPLTSINVSI